MEMPGILEAILKHCPDRSAEALWKWLDETPDATEQMIKLVADNHPKVKEKLCGSALASSVSTDSTL